MTLRVVEDVGYLRKRHLYRGIRTALRVVARRADYRIVHFSIQGNHLHLLCEANTRTALGTGIKAFEISAAKRLNAEISHRRGVRRKGRVLRTATTHARSARFATSAIASPTS